MLALLSSSFSSIVVVRTVFDITLKVPTKREEKEERKREKNRNCTSA
jgi:hypothetical protein